MKIKSLLKKGLAITLCGTMAFSAAIFSVSARTIELDGATVEKISNSETGQREIDGLVEGGDRETSYAWCMASRGDYVYIGTNKNILGMASGSIINGLIAQGMSEELVTTAINAITNGEFPEVTTTEGGQILRCDVNTGEIKVIYTLPNYVAFRMAIEYNGNVYFGSYASVAGLSNDILRIDENDNIETVFTSYEGTSFRAACVHNDELYFGGVDASEVLDPGYEKCKKLAILCKDNEDDSVWNRVADYKDFGDYASNAALSSSAASPVWDICSYNGYIIASIPNSGGMIMFKGHPAQNGETANQYGWYWEEIVGSKNGINNIGLNEDNPEGYTGAAAGMASMVGTPFVFNDKLYVMDFDNTITAEIYAMMGLASIISGKDTKLSTYLRPMYTTLTHPQSLWCLDDETGKFEKNDSFGSLMEGNCNEYVWRNAVYDGELYISTMDSAVLYNYITKLTNGSIANMTPDELQDQIDYLEAFIKVIVKEKVSSTIEQKLTEALTQLKDILKELIGLPVDCEKVQAFVDKYSDTMANIKNIIYGTTLETNNTTVKDIIDKMKEIYADIDWEGLEMYAYISSTVAQDTWGFDLLKSSDGENFEVVTDNGFGDKYNYGGRSLLATDSGLYIGTANPFYGAQLWKLTNNEPEYEIGDVNQDGRVNIADVDEIQKYLIGIVELSDKQMELADVNNDGSVRISDATHLQKILLGID